MDYNQLREILVNTEALYNFWQATGDSEEDFIRKNKLFIMDTERARIQKEQTKARQKRFIEKQKAQGKRTLTAIVSGSTYDTLCQIRDKSIQAGDQKSLGEVLDDLISVSIGNAKQIKETKTEIRVPVETDHGKAIAGQVVQDIEYADTLFNKIESLKISGMGGAEIERKFNAEGVKNVSKRPFGRGGVDSFYKGRLKKNGMEWDNKLKKPVPKK